jgi:hypothetical protein
LNCTGMSVRRKFGRLPPRTSLKIAPSRCGESMFETESANFDPLRAWGDREGIPRVSPAIPFGMVKALDAARFAQITGNIRSLRPLRRVGLLLGNSEDTTTQS